MIAVRRTLPAGRRDAPRALLKPSRNIPESIPESTDLPWRNVKAQQTAAQTEPSQNKNLMMHYAS